MIYLVIVHGPDRGRSFQLENGRCYEIGRSLTDLPLQDSKLSRRHAEFISHDGDWFLTDLGSTNGTYVNGERVDKRCRLFDNDRIQVGNTLMVFGTAEAHRERQAQGAMPVLHENSTAMGGGDGDRSGGSDARAGHNDETMALDAIHDLDPTEKLQDHDLAPTASRDRSVTHHRTTDMQHQRPGTMHDADLVPAELDDGSLTAITVHQPSDAPIVVGNPHGWKIVLLAIILMAGGLVALFFYDKQQRELLMMQLASQTRDNADFIHEQQLDEILSEVRKPNHDIYVNEKLDLILTAVADNESTMALDGHTLASQLHEAIGAEQSQQTQALLEKTLAAVEATAETDAVSDAEQRELQKQMMAMLLELKTEISELRKARVPSNTDNASNDAQATQTARNSQADPNNTEATNATDGTTTPSDTSTTTSTTASSRDIAQPQRPAPPTRVATIARPTRIAFVVDASGSMRDVIPSVLRLLQRTVTRLDENKSATLIFYQNDRVIEVEPYGFKPTNEAGRAAMIQWLEPDGTRILPQGESNPQMALERAMRYQPDIIWLLTDQIDQADLIFGRVSKLNHDGAIRINTMQLLDQDPTGSMAALAQQNGGTHHQVTRTDLRRFDPRVSLRQ